MKLAAVSMKVETAKKELSAEYLRIRGYRIITRGAKVCEFNRPEEYGL